MTSAKRLVEATLWFEVFWLAKLAACGILRVAYLAPRPEKPAQSAELSNRAEGIRPCPADMEEDGERRSRRTRWRRCAEDWTCIHLVPARFEAQERAQRTVIFAKTKCLGFAMDKLLKLFALSSALRGSSFIPLPARCSQS